MPVVQITDVHKKPVDYQVVYGGFLETPRAGQESDVYRIELSGWALSRNSPVLFAEAYVEGEILSQVPLNLDRPDIEKGFPGAPGARRSGFRMSVNAARLNVEFEFHVRIVLEDKRYIQIATVRGRRSSLRTGPESSIHPLLLTSLGRSGSSWVMLLLAQHPQLVAYLPFHCEPRVASYWVSILKTLSEPASYLQMVHPELTQGAWWTGDVAPERQARSIDLMNGVAQADPGGHHWLAKTHIDDLAGFCRNRIEAFYNQAAQSQGRPQALYFAEKHFPDNFVIPVVRDLYPKSKEIFLVRDFRDVVCSVLSFNKKLGYQSFGRALANTDEEYTAIFRSHAQQLATAWKQRADSSHLLRYEDIMQDPETALARVFEYLGLDADSATVGKVLQAAHATSPDAQRDHQTSSGGQSASVGRWRQDLSESMQKACMDNFGDLLQELGYE